MDIDLLSDEQKDYLSKRLDMFIETSKYSIQHQADSFNSINSKVDFLLASIGVFITILLSGIGLSNGHLDDVFSFVDPFRSWFTITLIAVYVCTVVTNMVMALHTIKPETFYHGRDAKRLRDLNNLNISNLKMKNDISEGLEYSYNKNIGTLSRKLKKYKRTQTLWVVNLTLTIVLILLIMF